MSQCFIHVLIDLYNALHSSHNQTTGPGHASHKSTTRCAKVSWAALCAPRRCVAPPSGEHGVTHARCALPNPTLAEEVSSPTSAPVLAKVRMSVRRLKKQLFPSQRLANSCPNDQPDAADDTKSGHGLFRVNHTTPVPVQEDTSPLCFLVESNI